MPINSDPGQHTWPPPTHHYNPYPYAAPYAPPSSSRAPRPEFAVPALPQRTLSGTALAPHVQPPAVPTVHTQPSVAAKRGRRPYAGEKQDAIWSPEVQDAFLQAARTIPNNGKNWIMRDGRQYGRNALIAEEIYRLTGQHRTRQQISSHIQVLKKVHADDAAMMRILNGQLDDPSASAGAKSTGLSGSASNSASPPVVKTEESNSSASPPASLNPVQDFVDGSTSFMSLVRSEHPSVRSESAPSTPHSAKSNPTSMFKLEPLQLAELIPRSAVPAPPAHRAPSEPLVAELDGVEQHPGAWRGERLAYITAITIWAERTLTDAGVRSRPTTTHVFAQMHSARCPLEKLPDDMEEIVRTIGPGTCMHAEIGIALPPAGLEVGKIKATLVIEAMKQFDGYCLTDAFAADGSLLLSTHTSVFPTGREAREKYSWTYEIPYATDVWKQLLAQNPESARGMRLVQKYVRSLAGGNPGGDRNVALMVVHDVKVVPPGEVGYTKIKHVDLTGEQAQHDAVSTSVTVNGESQEDDNDESSMEWVDEDEEVEDSGQVEAMEPGARPRPNLSVAIPQINESQAQPQTRFDGLAGMPQPVTPFEQVLHTPQHPPALQAYPQDMRRWLWAPTPSEGIPGGSGVGMGLGGGAHPMTGGIGDGSDRMSWLTRDALAAGTPRLGELAGRDQRLDAPARISSQGGYFGMN